MNCSLYVFAVLCIHIAFCRHPIYEDMECVCMNKLNRKLSVQMKIAENLNCHDRMDNFLRPKDCKAIYDHGNKSNGVYKIYPKGNIHGYKVYCDMTTDGGGWTVFQKRFDGGVDFYRTWNEYRNGFGDVYDEYWLGNEKLHQLTTQSTQILRIDMMDGSGTWKYATYSDFSISGNETGYRLSIGSYSGNAGDSLALHKGEEFKTKDKPGRCQIQYHGAWWYKDSKCHHSNLNGNYSDHQYGKGLNWYSWRGHKYSLEKTEMKIRREN